MKFKELTNELENIYINDFLYHGKLLKDIASDLNINYKKLIRRLDKLKIREKQCHNIKMGKYVSERNHVHIGQTFNRLTIIGEAFQIKSNNHKQTYTYVVCECQCSNLTIVEVNDLHKNSTVSCGCYIKEYRYNPIKNFNKTFNNNIVHLFIKNKTIIIDKDIYEKYQDYNIHISSSSAFIQIEKKSYQLSRFVLGLPNYGIVDHISGNRLDNRRTNLRIVNAQQNVHNSHSRKGVSIYKGVSFNTKTNKYYTRITIDGISKNIGCFETEEAAAKAYDKKAREIYKKYGRYNFPRKNEQPAIRKSINT